MQRFIETLQDECAEHGGILAFIAMVILWRSQDALEFSLQAKDWAFISAILALAAACHMAYRVNKRLRWENTDRIIALRKENQEQQGRLDRLEEELARLR